MRLWTRQKDLHPSADHRSGSALRRLADQVGRRPHRRAQPEVEALDLRLLMASSNPGMAQTAASAELSERVGNALIPYLERNDFPGISVAIVTDGQVALRKDMASQTRRRRRLSKPTRVSTSVRLQRRSPPSACCSFTRRAKARPSR